MGSTASATSTDSISSMATQEQQMLQEQEQVNMQQEQFETQSSVQQANHDTMMAIIRAISS